MTERQENIWMKKLNKAINDNDDNEISRILRVLKKKLNKRTNLELILD